MHEDVTVIKANLVQHYDHAREYHEQNYLNGGEYLPLRYRQYYIEKMIEGLQLAAGAQVLDVGCGPGELVLHLLRKGYDARGIDISPAMIQEAIGTLRSNGFDAADRFSVGDIERLEFPDGSFDVVVAAGVIEYQKTDGPTLTEMNRVIKRGGHLILNVTNRYSYTTLFETPYRWLKKSSFGFAMLGGMKRLIGRGEVHEFPDRRTHSPAGFDRALSEFGFTKVRHNYFHFSPLPIPLDNLLRCICHPVGRRMESLTSSPLSNLGGGYLVMSRRERSAR
ncbi:MAG TPA: methyltransferase domain-containing protein [Terriglobales bacterium]|nr:methyltransferase domain-containing protein [Terriglobales bacterium]